MTTEERNLQDCGYRIVAAIEQVQKLCNIITKPQSIYRNAESYNKMRRWAEKVEKCADEAHRYVY